jgi:acid phosphatase type 7
MKMSSRGAGLELADCASEGDEATARLVGGIEGTVLTLGDNAYPDGTAQDFEECYDPSWGQFKERTRPAPGNHEYETGGSSAYFHYFGDAAGDPDEGYYSYDLESWHMVVLNSNCGVGEIRCGPGSPRDDGSRKTSPPTTRRLVPLPTSTTRFSLRGRIVPASNGWSDFGRSSTLAASTWC